jgi:hypothetical protein
VGITTEEAELDFHFLTSNKKRKRGRPSLRQHHRPFIQLIQFGCNEFVSRSIFRQPQHPHRGTKEVQRGSEED